MDTPTRADGERKERLDQKDRVLQYGVSYLDDATGGIGVNELVLIGAKTGVGKTQLVTRIASFNARRKKRVALFALEAEPNEIERRIKFSVLAAEFRRRNPSAEVNLNYRDWRRGAFDAELSPFEESVNAMIRERYSTLRTIYKGWGSYTVSDLERDITRLAPTTDLIIVDHLHYIDSSEGSRDEFEEQKRVLKVLRDLALSLSKPIVLVAHLRKTMGGRKSAPLVPDLEDFHGSSDIIKIATTAILLAPCYENMALFTAGVPDRFIDHTLNPPRVARLWATYMRVGKFRIEGAITRYTGIAFFDDATGNYRDQYGVGRLVSGDCSWVPEEHPPFWATHGILRLAEH
jgi:archaellum biogenesis ATPase FlaH